MVTFQGGGDGAQPRGGACAGHERQHGSGVRLPGDGVEHLVGSDNRTQRQVSEQQSDQGVYFYNSSSVAVSNNWCSIGFLPCATATATATPHVINQYVIH